MNNLKKISLYALAFVVAITMLYNLFEDVDAGEIVVIQSPISGDLTVVTSPGWTWQGGGKATHYRKSSQAYFLTPEDAKKLGIDEDEDRSLGIQFNDGGMGHVSGSMRIDLPTVPALMIKVHSTYGSQTAIETQLVSTNISKAISMSGPLMSSQESYAERKNDLLYYIEDQSSKGAYKTKQVEVKETDALSEEIKTVTRVQILEKSPGNPYRQEKSAIEEYGIRLHNLAIAGIHYNKVVNDQIKTRQNSISAVQTSIAMAKKAQQDAITTKSQGEADAAKAKWEQEVVKAKLVTAAEARKEQSALDVETAKNLKIKLILEGEGEAAKKRAAMVANGGLEQKLATYERVNAMWAKAMGEYSGSLVPTYVSGGGQSGNAGMNLMEMIGFKTARDLTLDMKNK